MLKYKVVEKKSTMGKYANQQVQVARHNRRTSRHPCHFRTRAGQSNLFGNEEQGEWL